MTRTVLAPKVAEITQPMDRALASEIAALVRKAHAATPSSPGLPVADGAAETTADVLAAGGRFWQVRVGAELIATLRVHAKADAWAVSRVAVTPAWQRRGIMRSLLDSVESTAITEGVGRIELEAVVERGLSPLYARLGFVTVDRRPAPDKPLTEVLMARVPGTDRRHEPDGVPPVGTGLVLTWFATGDGTVVVPRFGDLRAPEPGAPERRARTIGVDVWPAAHAEDRTTVLSVIEQDGVRHLPYGGFHWRRRPVDVVGYRMPRLIAPALLALWRPANQGRADRS
jgi:GNAT superfamily N-acetyltransferase